MHYRYVHYNLEHGYIHNWLVAGPQAIPVNLEQYPTGDIQAQIAQQHFESVSGITKTPVERGPLDKGLFQIGDYQGSWGYFACREDHLVDHSGVYPAAHYLRSWAYTQLFSKVAQEVWLVLTTHGPADVWLNGQHVHRQEHFHTQQPGSVGFKVLLVEGANKLLVRFENVAYQACAHAMALQVCLPPKEGSPSHPEPYPSKTGIHIRIPSLIEAISRRNTFEQVSATAYVMRDIFEGPGAIELYWPADLEGSSATTVRLQSISGPTYAEADVDGTPGDKLFLGFPYQIPEGAYRIVMMPRPWEVYEKHTRITREIPLWIMGANRYSNTPYGSYADRRQEALISAARRKGLFAEIAKIALGQWDALSPESILQATQQANPLTLIGLLGVLYRFGEHPLFPAQLAQPLEDCILSFPYGTNGRYPPSEPGEGQVILSLTCEILAGQRYPKHKFSHSGKTGTWHRKNGEERALEWLQQRGATGFADWDASDSFAEILIALSHLVDLAKTQPVRELASVMMDKIFLSIALNSYQGVFGSSHGRTCASCMKGGFLEPTSGIARLMWGTGIFNHHITAPVSLACMANYELSTISSNIAISKPEGMWSRERHAVNAERVVNKVTYKTPDFMLCSAQDYSPGEKGRTEHIWQATLGAGATVFVNHPACTSESDARQPNFWAGNAVLPRVAQWKDALIAIYHLPQDDWMGFTHAYFPTYAFDEYVIREGWAFARKGDGYLALTASAGIQMVQSGQYAYQELRSYGYENTWICEVGRAALDGNFSTFQKKVLALGAAFEGSSVRFTTLRGEKLSFGWQGAFLRDGEALQLSGFMHYENAYVAAAYPCTQMEVAYGEDMMRIDFRDVS